MYVNVLASTVIQLRILEFNKYGKGMYNCKNIILLEHKIMLSKNKRKKLKTNENK